MFKRLAGSEFCSEAHRREYKEEYSQLALGRLLQSKPPETQEKAGVKAGTMVTASVEEKPPAGPLAKAPTPVVSKAAPIMMPPAQTKAPPATFSAKKVDPVNPKPHAEPAATKMTAADPAIAASIRVQKPAPAGQQLAVVVTAELERTMAFLQPDRPRREAIMSPAGLPEGSMVRLDRRIEVADLVMHPMERNLELRESVRAAPEIALDFSIVGPESLDPQIQSLSIPAPPLVAPPEAPLWMEAPPHFTGSAIALGDITKFHFSTTGFAEPLRDPLLTSVEASGAALDGMELSAITQAALDSGDDTVAEIEPLADACEPEVQDASGPAVRPEASEQPNISIPELVLKSLPVAVQGVAAGKSKAIQVFGAVSFSVGTVQVPQPSGLPLRPLMVLAAAETPSGSGAAGKKSKASFLPPTQPTSSQPELKTPVQTPAEAGPPSSKNTVASRMPKILAAVAGAAVITIGGFLLLTSRSDAGPNVTISAPAGSDQWINDFAPEAKQQRKVSVLRSSMGLADYRVDFESSIGIKALGWV